jgi:hypothetical protein
MRIKPLKNHFNTMGFSSLFKLWIAVNNNPPKTKFAVSFAVPLEAERLSRDHKKLIKDQAQRLASIKMIGPLTQTISRF